MKKDKCTRIQNELAKLIETAEAGCPRPETIPKDKDKEERIIANLEKNQGSRVLAKIFFRISTRKTPYKVNRDLVLRDGPMFEQNLKSLSDQLALKKKQVKRRKKIIQSMRQLLSDRIECKFFHPFILISSLWEKLWQK